MSKHSVLEAERGGPVGLRQAVYRARRRSRGALGRLDPVLRRAAHRPLAVPERHTDTRQLCHRGVGLCLDGTGAQLHIVECVGRLSQQVRFY